jgi:hypothetical protein
MHPACQKCRGACCQDIILTPSLFAHPTTDFWRWMLLHGELLGGDRFMATGILLKTPCRCLQDGLCDVYENRPANCALFPVGGPGCRAAIARNRSKGQQRKILELI